MSMYALAHGPSVVSCLARMVGKGSHQWLLLISVYNEEDSE